MVENLAVDHPDRVARRGEGAGEPGADPALVAVLALLDLGHQQADALGRIAGRGPPAHPRAAAQSPASIAARATAIAPSGWLARNSASRRMRFMPVAHRIAGPHRGIGVGDLGLRLDLPGGLEHLGGAAELAVAG